MEGHILVVDFRGRIQTYIFNHLPLLAIKFLLLVYHFHLCFGCFMQLSHLMSLLQPRNVRHFPPQTTPLVPQPSILKRKIVAKKKEALETCRERENLK